MPVCTVTKPISVQCGKSNLFDLAFGESVFQQLNSSICSPLLTFVLYRIILLIV